MTILCQCIIRDEHKLFSTLTHSFFFLFTDGEYVFVDPDNKVSKYASKAWKSSHEYVSPEHTSQGIDLDLTLVRLFTVSNVFVCFALCVCGGWGFS